MHLSTTPFHDHKPASTRLAPPVATSGPAKLFKEYQVNSTLTPASLRGQLPPTEHEKLVAQTQKWVAQTFYGAMLKQMRESPFKTSLSDGGRGGETFATMLDQHLSEKMARGTGSKLVNAIVRKIEAKKAYAKQQKPKDMRAMFQRKSSVEATRESGQKIPFHRSSVLAALRLLRSHNVAAAH